MALFDRVKSWFSNPSKSNAPLDQLDNQDIKISGIENQQVNNYNIEEQSESNTTDQFIDKAKDFVSDSMDEAKEQGKQLWAEIKEKVEVLDESTREFREKIADKAKEGLEKIDHFIDETVEKAKALDADEKKLDQNQDGIADKPVDFGKDLESTHPDFFNKAEKWLESQRDQTKVEQSKPIVNPPANKSITPVELPDETETS